MSVFGFEDSFHITEPLLEETPLTAWVGISLLGRKNPFSVKIGIYHSYNSFISCHIPQYYGELGKTKLFSSKFSSMTDNELIPFIFFLASNQRC